MDTAPAGPRTVPVRSAWPGTGARWNHHRPAAVSEGPAAASADAQSRRMIPKTRGLAVPLRLVLRTAALRFRALLVVVPRCARQAQSTDLLLQSTSKWALSIRSGFWPITR